MADLDRHLSGERTFGTYTLVSRSDEGVAFAAYGCVDLDTEDIDTLQRVWNALVGLIPSGSVVLEFSGRRGYHLWVVLDEPAPAAKVRTLLLTAVRKAGVETEVFPKQTILPDGGFGNLVRLPLGLHRVSGQWSYFVDPASLENGTPKALDPSELNISPLKESQIDKILTSAGGDVATGSGKEHTGGPDLDEMIPEGKRNSTLTSLGGALRWRGLSGAEINAALQEVNRRRCVPQLEAEEVRRIARSVSRYAAELSVVSENDEPLGDDAAGVPPHDGSVEPFPGEVLPQRIRSVVETAARSINCPIDFLGVLLLIFAAVAMGTARALEIKPGWEELPRFYMAVVADPGGRKSPAMKVASRPLDRRQAKLTEEYELAVGRYRDELARHEIREAEWRRALKSGEAQPEDKPEPPEEPVLHQVYTTDSTVEALGEVIERNPRGILLRLDELTAWVLSFNQYKGGKGADRQAFLSFWSGGTAIVNRKHRKNPLVLLDPFVCVAGCLPPDVLSDLSDERGREDGFIHRVLFSFPDAVKSQWVEDGIPESVLDDLDVVFESLWNLDPAQDAEGRSRPVKVRFTPGGRSFWVEWITSHYAEQEERHFPAGLRGPWAKFEGYCARMALVIHFLRLACGEVDAEEVDDASVASAWALVDYFKSHTRRVYQRLRTTRDDQQALQALEWIKRQPEKDERIVVSAREVLSHHVAGVKTSSEAKALLRDLEDRGFGLTEEPAKNRLLFTLFKPTQQAAVDDQDED